MADLYITQLDSVPEISDDDVLYVVDTSDITDSADGSSKKVTRQTFLGITGTVVGDDETQTLTNKTLTSPVINTGISGTAIADEDDMTSNSATKVPTQQSVKAYVDSGTATITNKTIDGDNNTLQDIAYSSIKSTSRSGSDATLITGTKGTSGNLSQWNADGDLVDGPDVLDEDNMVSNSASAVATQQSIKAYIDSGTVTMTNKTLTMPTINATKHAWTVNADAATITFDMDVSNVHRVTLGDNRILAVSNVDAGQAFIITLIQDATGSRTVTWFTDINWDNNVAPTLTTTATRADVFGFLALDENDYYGFILGQNHPT